MKKKIAKVYKFINFKYFFAVVVVFFFNLFFNV